MRSWIWRRRVSPAWYLALVSTSFLLTPARSAVAALPCTSLESNSFDGFTSPTSANYYYSGSSAHLIVREGLPCTTDPTTNATSAWTMVANNSTNGWAQSGYVRWQPGTAAYHFAQQSPDGLAYVTNTCYACGWLNGGESHMYWQEWKGSCNCVLSNVDVTTFLYSSFNPKAIWTIPFLIQFSGETSYLQSDMPGTAFQPGDWRALQAQQYDGNWVSVPCYLLGFNDNPSRWGRGADSCSHFWIWTR